MRKIQEGVRPPTAQQSAAEPTSGPCGVGKTTLFASAALLLVGIPAIAVGSIFLAQQKRANENVPPPPPTSPPVSVPAGGEEENEEDTDQMPPDYCTQLCKGPTAFCEQFDIDDELQCRYYRDVICECGGFDSDVDTEEPTESATEVPSTLPPTRLPTAAPTASPTDNSTSTVTETPTETVTEAVTEATTEANIPVPPETTQGETLDSILDAIDDTDVDVQPVPTANPTKACLAVDAPNAAGCALYRETFDLDCCDGLSCETGIGCYPSPRRKGDPCLYTFGGLCDGPNCCGNGLRCEATERYVTFANTPIGECKSTNMYTCPEGYSGIYPYNSCTQFIWCRDGKFAGGPRDCPQGGTLFDIPAQVCLPAEEVDCEEGERLLRMKGEEMGQHKKPEGGRRKKRLLRSAGTQ